MHLDYLSCIVYKFKCGVNYDKTKRYFKVWMCEHLQVSAVTEKRLKGDNDFTIEEH